MKSRVFVHGGKNIYDRKERRESSDVCNGGRW